MIKYFTIEDLLKHYLQKKFHILYSGNYCSVADTFIFPILFDIWHGVELWLKSSVDAIYYFN